MREALIFIMKNIKHTQKYRELYNKPTYSCHLDSRISNTATLASSTTTTHPFFFSTLSVLSKSQTSIYFIPTSSGCISMYVMQFLRDPLRRTLYLFCRTLSKTHGLFWVTRRQQANQSNKITGQSSSKVSRS